MKILIVGLGSIGKRHLDNIAGLGFTAISIVSSKEILPEQYAHLHVYKTLQHALEQNSFDVAFICTPTALHVTQLLLLLVHRVEHIYVEKPLSHSLAQVDKAMQLADSYPNKIVVGYDLRFDPAINKTRELINEKKIGDIISANAFAGQHLSQWRPSENYRNGTSAKTETGGGVLLDLIHEFDYLYWLIGDVDSVACNCIHSVALGIETEDAADVLLKFSNGVSGTVHLDYLQQKLERHCIFTGSLGTVTLDLANRNVILVNESGETEKFDYINFERNDRFVAIVESFLENKNDERLTGLDDAMKSLQIVLAAKYSSENNCFVNMKKFITQA